ncbi:hypothetical protein IQ06DRAFT_119077 [Phaeosphaeriaceae sp. SRC1lsM3a]|nr:hypothetical protein IQ06DRAFT_119077 [Stagonospora sp. SRC1lsM3a]
MSLLLQILFTLPVAPEPTNIGWRWDLVPPAPKRAVSAEFKYVVNQVHLLTWVHLL